MNILAVLQSARALHGQGCGSVGAIAYASSMGNVFGQPDHALFNAAALALRDQAGGGLVEWDANESVSRADRLAAFDRAIAELEPKPEPVEVSP